MFCAFQLLAEVINRLRSRSNVRDSRINVAWLHGLMVSDTSEDCQCEVSSRRGERMTGKVNVSGRGGYSGLGGSLKRSCSSESKSRDLRGTKGAGGLICMNSSFKWRGRFS